MNKRRLTGSSDNLEEEMEEGSEDSPTTISTKKRKRLDPVRLFKISKYLDILVAI